MGLFRPNSADVAPWRGEQKQGMAVPRLTICRRCTVLLIVLKFNFTVERNGFEMSKLDKIKQAIERGLEWLLDKMPKTPVPAPVPVDRTRRSLRFNR
jgi:hypothetical protein